MKIELLTTEEVARLEPVFAREWDACLPDPRYSHILAEKDSDGRIRAFVTLENVVLVSNAYVAPEYRGWQGVGALRRLTARIQQSADNSGRTFLTIAHSSRRSCYATLFRALGLRKFADAVWRKDFFRL